MPLTNSDKEPSKNSTRKTGIKILSVAFILFLLIRVSLNSFFSPKLEKDPLQEIMPNNISDLKHKTDSFVKAAQKTDSTPLPTNHP